MDNLVFEIVRFVVVVAVILLARYGVPLLRQFLASDRMSDIVQWVEQAVQYAQQVYWGKTGEERKAIVLKFLKELLASKHIDITDEQLNVLIESAVKAMKMKENAGTVELQPAELKEAVSAETGSE